MSKNKDAIKTSPDTITFTPDAKGIHLAKIIRKHISTGTIKKVIFEDHGYKSDWKHRQELFEHVAEAWEKGIEFADDLSEERRDFWYPTLQKHNVKVLNHSAAQVA